MSGILYIVATPIGNLEDLTARALRILKEVDLIAAEDPRTTLKLLTHFGITKPLISYTEHKWYFSRTPSKERQRHRIIEELVNGRNVALVCRAGTPLIADPGYELINVVAAEGIKTVPIPGVSAVITALSVAGLPTDRFLFEGFLPLKKGKRTARLKTAARETATVVFYESPYRITRTLAEIREHFGDRRAVLGRELTKFYEEIQRGTLDELINGLTPAKIKGEYTIIVAGNQETESKSLDSLE